MSIQPYPEESRRAFLLAGGAAVLGTSTIASPNSPWIAAPAVAAPRRKPQDDDAGVASPELTQEIIANAERLAGITFTPKERAQLLESIPEQLAMLQMRTGAGFLPNELAPATVFDPRLPWMSFDHLNDTFARSADHPGPLPEDEADIAFAPVTQLSRWIESRQLTSMQLTELYLERLKRFDPALECVITLTEALALQQAARADDELEQGLYRGPLHGIPWGIKDLFDTAGIRTTWGATPYVRRVPARDAAVVRKLEDAGAVLVAKLSLGALAYNDIWFGGRTNNPFRPEQGSSGSSAGSAAATAAGLVGFALGTETYGSIVSPCMRCGTTGLRPTFGRVSRDGAMALCWSLDKVGPICRTVEDCALVLQAINGYDEADPSSIDMPFSFTARRGIGDLRVGFNPAWFESRGSSELDRQTLRHSQALGAQLVEIELPDWPYDALLSTLFCEAAAAFEELTREDLDDTLNWQESRAWPNTFRQSWFIPGIEVIQADRWRRRVMEMMAELYEHVDVILAPSFVGSLLLITNFTGHPSLTIRNGFSGDGTPHGITLFGNLFEEGMLCSLGMALERAHDVWHVRPEL